MKKYVPSVINNQQIREDVLKNVRASLFLINKKQFNSALDENYLYEVSSFLQNALNELEYTLGTGSENIENVYNEILKANEDFKTSLTQSLNSRVEKATKTLSSELYQLIEILNGQIVYSPSTKDVSQNVKKLTDKLEQIDKFKNDFSKQEMRLENEIRDIESEIEELNQRIINETNERILEESFKKVTTNKTKIQALKIRKQDYNVCYNIVDMMVTNIREVIYAGEYATSELLKAKSFLKLSDLDNLLVNPEKAIPILKVMQNELSSISNKIHRVDESVFGKNTVEQHTDLTNALKYKEELLKKQNDSIENLNSAEKEETNSEKKKIVDID